VSVGPFYAGKSFGGGRRGDSGGGGWELIFALVGFVVPLVTFLVGAALWLAVAAVLVVVDLVFGVGRGVGWAFGSRARGESIQERGILRWGAVRWFWRAGVTDWVWGWAFDLAEKLAGWGGRRRGPREWLREGALWSLIAAPVLGVAGGVMIFFTGSSLIRDPERPRTGKIDYVWAWGDVEWWAWGTIWLAALMPVVSVVCYCARGFFSPVPADVASAPPARPVATSASPGGEKEPADQRTSGGKKKGRGKRQG